MATARVSRYITNRIPERSQLIILFTLLFFILGVALSVRLAAPAGHVLPSVRIAGISVGGMQPAEVAQLLETKLSRQISNPIRLRWDGGSEFIYPSDIGLEPDIDAMVTQAMQVGRQGGLLHRALTRLLRKEEWYHIPLQLEGEENLRDLLNRLRAKIDRPPVNAGFTVSADGNLRPIPEKAGLLTDIDRLYQLVIGVLTESERTVTVPVEFTEPEVTHSKLQALGIRTVVASAETTFDPSNFNRTENLRIGAKALDGAVLAPGEMFSFNKRVGPRAEHLGYKEAPVVIDGELVPDIGGGICQVSTTLYHAVLKAGLQVNARSPHSIPSTYVPLGLDAAVVYDYTDFRFTNNTEQYLYISAWLDADTMHVMLLGLHPAPKTRLVSNIEEVLPIPKQEILDPELPLGMRVVEKEGAKGYIVTTWRVIEDNGREQWQKITSTTYKPRPEVQRVGTAIERPPTPVSAVSQSL
jgi:vancomycin resistance protein YoaR